MKKALSIILVTIALFVALTFNTALADATATPAPTTTIGIDMPSKSWFIAAAGSMISADMSLFDNDNNSRKFPVYDNDAGTADIIVIGDTPTYVWSEWGCHYWETPTQQDLEDEISKKLNEGFVDVRVFPGLTRENYGLDPVIYN